MSKDTFAELYPFESNFFKHDGLRYHYLDEGSGPVLLMLHGNPTWSFYYRELVCGLRNRFRVIVPDHIGCGFSDKPQRYPYRLQTHINNVEALLEHLGIEQYSLAVHDWGGPIGFGVGGRKPERVERLIVFNTTACLTRRYPIGILACKVPLLGSIAVRGFNLFAKCAVWFASCNPEKMTKDIAAGFLKPYDSYANRVATLAFVRDIPLNDKHPSWQVAKTVVDNIHKLADKPVMICWGTKDFCFTDFFLKDLRQRFPQAHVHEFHDAGHYVVEDAGDEILELVERFLDGR